MRKKGGTPSQYKRQDREADKYRSHSHGPGESQKGNKKGEYHAMHGDGDSVSCSPSRSRSSSCSRSRSRSRSRSPISERSYDQHHVAVAEETSHKSRSSGESKTVMSYSTDEGDDKPKAESVFSTFTNSSRKKKKRNTKKSHKPM